MARTYIVNAIVVFGLATIVSLSWVGFPQTAGWSRFVGSVLFYAGIEMVLWLITHPLIQQRTWSLETLKNRRRLPPE